jgi:sec-independent protein translocase protein TatA
MKYIVLALIVLIVFGAGKLPKVMGDLGKGLKSFRDGMNGEEEKKDIKTEGKVIDVEPIKEEAKK